MCDIVMRTIDAEIAALRKLKANIKKAKEESYGMV